MPGPAPSGTAARRNHVSTATKLTAPAAARPELAARHSTLRCVAKVDAKAGCKLGAANHDLEHFAEHEIQPHEFEPATIDWHPQTLAWWEAIWDSPMATLWIEADVPQLQALALLVDLYWRTGSSTLAAEIRLQGREHGLSQLSRRMLHWQVQVTDPAPKIAPAPSTRPKRKRDPRLTVLK